MNTNNQIEIHLSKKKLTKLLIASLMFVAIGLWFVVSPPIIEYGRFRNPTLILIWGIASVSFFGIIAVAISLKLKDNKPGLIVDGLGITDNASGLSAGHIPWNDIKEFKIVEVVGQKILMILVFNPDYYINNQTNVIKRKVAEMNNKAYGSPISISTNTLKCEFEVLNKILQDHLNKNKI